MQRAPHPLNYESPRERSGRGRRLNSLDLLQMFILCAPLTAIGVLLLAWNTFVLIGLVLTFICGAGTLFSLLGLIFHRWLRK